MLNDRHDRDDRDDSGVTMAELMVAMGLMTVVGVMALTFFVWTGRSTSQATTASFGTNEARVAVTTVAGTVRLADSPTSAIGSATGRIQDPLSASTITFYANDNGNRPVGTVRTLPTRVTFTLGADGTLVELRYAPLAGAVASSTTWAANYPQNPTARRTLLTGIASGTFGYDYVDPTRGLTTAPDPTAITSAVVVSVTLTVTLRAAAGRPTQSYTATGVITGAST